MAERNSFAIISSEAAFNLVRKFKMRLEERGVPIEHIYIYGSYAKGNPRYGSDIDVCVISPAFKNRFEASLMLRSEAIEVDSRIEPVAYSPETFQDWIPLVWEIQQNGVSLN